MEVLYLISSPVNGVRLVIEQTQVKVVQDKKEIVVIPASAVTEISSVRTFIDASVQPSDLLLFRSV